MSEELTVTFFDVSTQGIVGLLRFVETLAHGFFAGAIYVGDWAVKAKQDDATDVTAVENANKYIARVWSNTFMPILVELAIKARAELSKVDWTSFKAFMTEYASWAFIKGLTGRESSTNDKSSRIQSNDYGLKARDWYASEITAAGEWAASRNTVAVPPVLPPLIAAFVENETDQEGYPGETASPGDINVKCMVDLLVQLRMIKSIGGVAEFDSSSSFVSNFLDVKELANAKDKATADTLEKGSGNDFKKLFITNYAGQEKVVLSTTKNSREELFVLLVRDYVNLIAPTLKSVLLVTVAQRQIAHLTVAYITQVDVTTADNSSGTLTKRLALRPLIGTTTLKSAGQPSAKYTAVVDDMTVTSDALFDVFRDKLSTAIKNNPLAGSTSLFINDASNVKDAGGLTLFDALDKTKDSRQYTVLVPQNAAWLEVQKAANGNKTVLAVYLGRHVLWSTNKAINFLDPKIGNEPIDYATILVDNPIVTRADRIVNISVTRGGLKNNDVQLHVTYKITGETQTLRILSEPTRAKTGRFFIVDRPIWHDRYPDEPRPGVAIEEKLPPAPAPSSVEYVTLPTLVPPSNLPPPIATDVGMITSTTSRTTSSSLIPDQSPMAAVTHAGATPAELGQIHRDTTELLRNTRTIDDAKKLVNSGKELVVFLPPHDALAALYKSKPSAEAARAVALHHVVYAQDLSKAIDDSYDARWRSSVVCYRQG